MHKLNIAIGKFNYLQKRFIIMQVLYGIMSRAEASRAFNIPRNALRTLLYRHRIRSLCGSFGRPPLLDEKAGSQITKLLNEQQDKQHCIKKQEFKQIFMEKVNEANARRKKPLVVSVSNRTVRRAMKHYGWVAAIAESKTAARLKAESDLFNAISFIVMMKSLLMETSAGISFVLSYFLE